MMSVVQGMVGSVAQSVEVRAGSRAPHSGGWMREVSITVGTGLLLLFIEYVVVQRFARSSDASEATVHVVGDHNVVSQQVDRRRTLILTRVTAHAPRDNRSTAASSSGDDTILWLIGALVAVVALCAGLGMYGHIVRAAMMGIALGLLLLAISLLMTKRLGGVVSVGRWAACAIVMGGSLVLGASGLMSREFNGVTLTMIRGHLTGRPVSDWPSALGDLLEVPTMAAFAFQAMGGLFLIVCSFILLVRLTAVFAAVGALAGRRPPGRMQAWLVGRWYEDSPSLVWGIVFAAVIGAALSGGWLSELVLSRQG
jgi:hypothetical protein